MYEIIELFFIYITQSLLFLMNPISFYNNNLLGAVSTAVNSNPNGHTTINGSNNCMRLPSSSSTWINKLKIVGRGQNWAVTPCEPFYLMGMEPPAFDGAITGAKNLIEHYGLESAYQKFCGKRLKEELSAFLPHMSGNVDVPASVDKSGLMVSNYFMFSYLIKILFIWIYVCFLNYELL